MHLISGHLHAVLLQPVPCYSLCASCTHLISGHLHAVLVVEQGLQGGSPLIHVGLHVKTACVNHLGQGQAGARFSQSVGQGRERSRGRAQGQSGHKASGKPTTLQGFCETHNPNKSKPGGEEEEEAGRRRRRSGAEKKKMKRDGEEEEEEEEEEAGGKEDAGPWF